MESVPATIPKINCSMRTAYIPALTIGIAQQQYSLGFMVVGCQDFSVVMITPFRFCRAAGQSGAVLKRPCVTEA